MEFVAAKEEVRLGETQQALLDRSGAGVAAPNEEPLGVDGTLRAGSLGPVRA